MPRKSKPKPTHVRVELAVAGRGRFPVEMLRYDQCAPRSSGDASAIVEGCYHEGAGYRIVMLSRYTATGNAPAADRWASFGWHVLDESEVLAYANAPLGTGTEVLRAIIAAR